MTHPQQPTEGPIFAALSPAKRQVLQGKPFVLSSPRPRTSPHRHMHRATPPRYAPARTSHRSPSRATYPTTPPHHTPASHPCTTCPITPPHHAPAPHAPAPSPPQSRMQFPHGTNRRTLKNRGISTIRLQNLKHSQGNCMRNCCARGRQGPADHTPPSPYQSRT